LKPSLQLRLSQHLALTPQLQQSIRLLQLSTLELHQEVEQMLEQNPFLEAEEDTSQVFEPMAERLTAAERLAERETERAAESVYEGADEPASIDAADFGTTDRDDWENGTEREDFDGIRETPGKARTNNDGDEFDASDRDAPALSLQDHLRAQLSNLRLDPLDAAAVGVLIESLDEDGYLADPLEEIAAKLSGRAVPEPAAEDLSAGAPAHRPNARADARLSSRATARSGRIPSRARRQADDRVGEPKARHAPAVGDGDHKALHRSADLYGDDKALRPSAVRGGEDEMPRPEGVGADGGLPPDRSDGDAVVEGPDDGYEEVLARLRCALRWLQSMEPTGVGARDLAECLTLQLRTQPRCEAQTIAIIVCKHHLPLLARRDLKKLMALTGADDELLRQAQALIVELEPKPGRPFSRAEANIIVPDVIVQKSGRGWKVVLNPDVMPKLRINDLYANAIRQQRGAGLNGASAGLNSRLQEARWFVKNILQRFDTIQRVSQAIVERQKGFFTHGEIAMKPLVLREIADELGLHESTISRVTTAKYMATPFGTFELKYFFGSSLGTDAGGAASSTAVRALIRQIVAAEDPAKPLSDSQISQMLDEQGIQVARRTVAKYREALKIAPTQLRKTM
jgi:RNA polymerase sigma-54 factor